MFEDVKSCSVSLSPNLCCCTLFMIDSLFSLDTFDIADLDSTQHTAHFLHIKNSSRGDFADKE